MSVEFFNQFFNQKLAQGDIPFSEYMAQVLYHQKCGYYSKHLSAPDYYTSVDVHPIFSKILAHFVADKLSRLTFGSLVIIEPGCGQGKLAAGILKELQIKFPKIYDQVTYYCLEESPLRRKKCEELKQIFPGHVEVLNNWNSFKITCLEQGGINGIILSNEFFDALPFDRVKNIDGKLMQSYLTTSINNKYDSNVVLSSIKYSDKLNNLGDSPSTFKEEWRPAQQNVKDFFTWLGHMPQEGSIAETHILSRQWIADFCEILHCGWILTIDYGYPARILLDETRPEGTALCHYAHQTNRNFFDHMGSQDITAHVNFSVLEKEAAEQGVKSFPLQTQTQFLLDFGERAIQETLTQAESAASVEPQTSGQGVPLNSKPILNNNNSTTSKMLQETFFNNISVQKQRIKTVAAIQSLLHPEGMGSTFKVLLQEKTTV